MRRMILILCSIMLAQASVGGTFYDVPYAGPAVTSEILGQAESNTVPGQLVSMLRVTYEPDGGITAHAISALTVYSVTSGMLDCDVLSGQARVVRALSGDMVATQTPIVEETILAGQEVTLYAGDTVYYETGAVQTERNRGDTPAVVLVTTVDEETGGSEGTNTALIDPR